MVLQFLYIVILHIVYSISLFQNIICFCIEVSSAVAISTFTFVTEITLFGFCA